MPARRQVGGHPHGDLLHGDPVDHLLDAVAAERFEDNRLGGASGIRRGGGLRGLRGVLFEVRRDRHGGTLRHVDRDIDGRPLCGDHGRRQHPTPGRETNILEGGRVGGDDGVVVVVVVVVGADADCGQDGAHGALGNIAVDAVRIGVARGHATFRGELDQCGRKGRGLGGGFGGTHGHDTTVPASGKRRGELCRKRRGDGGGNGWGTRAVGAGGYSRLGKRTALHTAWRVAVTLTWNTYQFRPEKGRGPPMTEAFIYDAIRTPRGKGKPGGALHEVKPIDLVVGLIEETRRRFPELDENRISDIILGIVSPLGDQGMDLPRIAALAAKMPDTVAGVQINRFCASGLTSINMAAQKIRSGWDDVVFAGGVESMSRVPMGSDGGAWAMDPATNYDTYFSPQGIGADLIATIEGFSREDVDRYAERSQRLAAQAWDEGRFAGSIVPVKDQNGLTVLDRDEHMRPGTTVETLAGLNPSFAMVGDMGGFDAVALQKYHWIEEINHVHHGGNSSGIVDGAALVVVGSEKAGQEMNMTPRARVVAAATSGADTTIMLTGPTPAAQKALATAGLTPDDIDLWEINEAFASVVLRFQKDMNIPDEKLNVNGGAIAMGHPLGATGAMITGTMIDELERTGGKRALITLCVGGGMGVATIIERV